MDEGKPFTTTFQVSVKYRSFKDTVAAAESGPKMVLEYSFLADLAAPSTITELVDCYRDVLAGTTVKPEIADCMLVLWLHGHLKGDPRLCDAAFGPLRTDGISFSWPWFSTWLERFRTSKVLPRAWEHFADQVKDRRLGFRHERVPLLAATLSARAYNRQRARQHAAHLGQPGTYRYELVPDCEASESIRDEMLAGLVPGDWRTYPPYFPGDRTYIHRDRR